MKFLFRNIFFLICLFFFSSETLAQIRMSKRMQYSQSANSDPKQLFLIEFWATWCAPCINVSKYLNTLQEKYNKELYIVSITRENPDVVEKFLQKHTTKLAVSLDYENENFNKYEVNALPYGVLINSQGEVLWKGNPANLKTNHIDVFLRKNKKTIPIYDFITYTSYEKEEVQEIVLSGDYQLTPSQLPKQEFIIVEQVSPVLTSLKGNLQQIFAFLLNVSPTQVKVSAEKNGTYTLIYNSSKNKSDLLKQIENQLKINKKETQKEGNILEVTLLSYQSLWDKKQINWGVPNAKYLVSDSEINLDDVSVQEALALVSQLHNTPILLLNNPKYINNEPYDWQIHYEFKELLTENLNNYGFKTNFTQGKYPFYSFE